MMPRGPGSSKSFAKEEVRKRSCPVETAAASSPKVAKANAAAEAQQPAAPPTKTTAGEAGFSRLQSAPPAKQAAAPRGGKTEGQSLAAALPQQPPVTSATAAAKQTSAGPSAKAASAAAAAPSPTPAVVPPWKRSKEPAPDLAPWAANQPRRGGPQASGQAKSPPLAEAPTGNKTGKAAAKRSGTPVQGPFRHMSPEARLQSLVNANRQLKWEAKREEQRAQAAVDEAASIVQQSTQASSSGSLALVSAHGPKPGLAAVAKAASTSPASAARAPLIGVPSPSQQPHGLDVTKGWLVGTSSRTQEVYWRSQRHPEVITWTPPDLPCEAWIARAQREKWPLSWWMDANHMAATTLVAPQQVPVQYPPMFNPVVMPPQMQPMAAPQAMLMPQQLMPSMQPPIHGPATRPQQVVQGAVALADMAPVTPPQQPQPRPLPQPARPAQPMTGRPTPQAGPMFQISLNVGGSGSTSMPTVILPRGMNSHPFAPPQ